MRLHVLLTILKQFIKIIKIKTKCEQEYTHSTVPKRVSNTPIAEKKTTLTVRVGDPPPSLFKFTYNCLTFPLLFLYSDPGIREKLRGKTTAQLNPEVAYPKYNLFLLTQKKYIEIYTTNVSCYPCIAARVFAHYAKFTRPIFYQYPHFYQHL